MKRIFIPFSFENGSIGGPQTFMRNLKKGLDKQNYSYKKSSKNADGMFFPISANIKEIKKVKKQGGKIIQRLDGIYYPSKHGNEYKELNKNIKYIYCKYSDYVIFQSEYSKNQVFEMFGEKEDSKYSLICNGADTDIFFPKEITEIRDTIKFITTGNFRNFDMIEPVIKALDLLQSKGYNFKLDIVGPITTGNYAQILSKKYVTNFKTSSQREIAQALRDSDVFIYSHLNPPCPNSVIEAYLMWASSSRI